MGLSEDLNAEIEKAIKIKKPSKKVNSIKKGHNFERKIAKYLTEILNIKIERVPMSGGFGTVHNTSDLSGDLFAPDGDLRFEIECKHYNLPNIVMDILNTKKKSIKIFDWIRQSKRDAKRSNKVPIIIFRTNRSPILTVIKLSYLKIGENLFLKNRENIIMFAFSHNSYIISPIDNVDIKGFHDALIGKQTNK